MSLRSPSTRTHRMRNGQKHHWLFGVLDSCALGGASQSSDVRRPRPCVQPANPHAAFTPGNLVIYRVGDGTSPLAGTGNPVFLDEYTTAGTLVQSIPMPTTVVGANRRLVAGGTATSEGLSDPVGGSSLLDLDGL